MLTRLTPEEPGLVAHHFDLGGETRQALSWYEQTIQQAEALFAWKEAQQYQNRMLSLLDQLDPHENQPNNILQRGLILLKRAHYYYLQGRLAESGYRPEISDALGPETSGKDINSPRFASSGSLPQSGWRVRKAPLPWQKKEPELSPNGKFAFPLQCQPWHSSLFEIAFAHYFLGQPQKGFSALHTAQDFAGPNPDPKVQGPIEHHLGYMLLHQGEYAEALIHQQGGSALSSNEPRL